jgi:hypothetical protein
LPERLKAKIMTTYVLMRSLAVSAILAAALLSACARVRVTTEIKPDGAWSRTVVLTGPLKKEGMQMPTLEDTFVIPSGAGWKSSDEKKNDNQVLTLERQFTSDGRLQGDVSIKGHQAGNANQPGFLRLTNEVSVKRIAPHQVEYRETLQWKGDSTKVLDDLQPEDLSKIKAHLPKALATDSNAHALAGKMAELAIPVMFGPGDPLLALGFLHPDLAVYRANQRLGGLVTLALEQQFGDKMQPAERRDVARRLIEAALTSPKMSTPDPAAVSASPGTSSGLTPLMFIVKPPGRIVSTNGETDDLSGDVFWAFFEEAAAYKELVLTAVVEVN